MTQDDLRKFLMEYRSVEPLSSAGLAKEIGICLQTLKGFLLGSKIKVGTWSKINKFVTLLIQSQTNN